MSTSVVPPSRVSAPLDRPWLTEPTLALRERLARSPSDATIKGWLFKSLVEGSKARGVELEGVTRRVGFKDYPLRDYLEALGQAAVRIRPEEPPRETLREIGRGVFGAFSQSLFGKVILAGLGNGHDGARSGLGWIAHVYKLTSNHARAQFTELNDHTSTIELTDVWTFPDCYHVGIFEGAARGFGGQVKVEVQSRSISSARLTFTWVDG